MEWLWWRPVAIFQVILVEVKEGGRCILIAHQQPTSRLIMPMINTYCRENQGQGIKLTRFVTHYRTQIRLLEVFKIHVAGISQLMRSQSLGRGMDRMHPCHQPECLDNGGSAITMFLI